MAFHKNHVVASATDKTNVNISSGADRISKAISVEQGKIEEQYLQIGKLYAASHPADFEEKYTDMMSAIATSEEKIGAYRMQSQILKGVIRCPICGNEAPDGSAFCNRCGAKIPPLDMNQFTVCPNCGKSVVKDMGNCIFCGSSLTASDSPLKCVKCGEPLETGARFCRSCGVAVMPKTKMSPKCVCPRCGVTLTDDILFCTECGQKL